MKQATRDAAFTFVSAAGRNERKFVRIADSTMKNVTISRDGKWAIGTDNREYISDWKESRADYYRVNTTTGERTLIVKEQKSTMGISPDSKYFLLWKDGHIHAYNLASATMTNLTAATSVSFVNTEHDYPGEPPSYGVSGWSKDGKSLIVNGRYDLWQIPLDAKPGKNLTNGYGDANEIRFRYINTDPEERFIDLAKPVYLSAYGQWTKKAGFSLLEKGKLTSLIYEDKSFGSPAKAKQADKFFLTIESPREYPDYYIADLQFKTKQKVTNTNPIVDEYNWYNNVYEEYDFGEYPTFNAAGNGGVWCSVDGLLKYVRAMENCSFLDCETMAKSKRVWPFPEWNSTEPSLRGISWVIHSESDPSKSLCIEHSGSQGGFRAHLLMYPNEQIVIVWLTNNNLTYTEQIQGILTRYGYIK